jgi:hypothetical protein
MISDQPPISQKVQSIQPLFIWPATGISTELTPFPKEKSLSLTNKFLKWELTELFRNKVDTPENPDSEEVIKAPMWLKEVKKRLREGPTKRSRLIRKICPRFGRKASNPRQATLHLFAELMEERFQRKLGALQKTPEEESLFRLRSFQGASLRCRWLSSASSTMRGLARLADERDCRTAGWRAEIGGTFPRFLRQNAVLSRLNQNPTDGLIGRMADQCFSIDSDRL